MRRNNQQFHAKVSFFQKVEKGIIETRPDLAGRLEWDTITHYWNVRKTIDESIAAYIANH